jgi:signal transduction histidine kinase/ActR/RegA family two-component response regulator
VQREDLFRTLFESSPDAILIEDENGHILDCNPAAAALHRTPREVLVGKHVSEVIPRDAAPQYEGDGLTFDGKRIPVSVRSSSIDYNGRPAVLLHVRDITDHKRFEKRLQSSHDDLEIRVQSRTAELAYANEILRSEIAERNRAEAGRKRLEEEIRGTQRMEAIGRLAGGVAHDFNNLLTVVIGRCEMMLSRLSPDSPMLPDLRLIHDTAGKAASVTRQLLAFGRKQILQPRVIDLNVVILNMKDILRAVTGEKIQLCIAPCTDLLSVEADRTQLEQVIMNLTVNAVDAMAHGGTLEIETSNVELGEEPPQFNFPIKAGKYVVVSVRDTGQGMSPETLSHVFEPFFSTKGETKGTGLGLSTVYGIVKQSGGYVVAQSREGEGSRFQVYLPGLQLVAEPVHEDIQRAAQYGIETILLTEDSKLVRELSREILQTLGYSIIEASNGEEALEICKYNPHRIDLILSDIIMKEMNGHELAEQAVQLRPGIKVVLMSGYADEITRDHIVKTGFQFIAKPFTSRDLATKIREALDG